MELSNVFANLNLSNPFDNFDFKELSEQITKTLTEEEKLPRRHRIQAVETPNPKNANQLSNTCSECFDIINGIEFKRIICTCTYHPECLLRVLLRHGITGLGNFPCKCMNMGYWKC